MKTTFITVSFLIIGFAVNAQSGIIERQKENAKNKINTRIENKIDKGMDKTLDKVEEIGKKEKKAKKQKDQDTLVDSKNQNPSAGQKPNQAGQTVQTDPKSLKKYSKFDFVRGEKILVEEHFETTEVGDFPIGWNTNASAEVVRLGEDAEKWISFRQDGYYSPEAVKTFPENFTLEFEVFTRYRSSNILSYGFEIGATENPRKVVGGDIGYMSAAFRFNWLGCNEVAGFQVYEKGEVMSENLELTTQELKCSGNDSEQYSKAHFSIWRQKNRLRVYINENKVLDVPYGLPLAYVYNVFRITANYMNFSTADNDDELMLSNLRYAIGAPDTRNKLITEGKLVTRGIQFDVNSANLKGESYGTLKEIATVLIENPTVKVKIVGHTDSDGDDKLNLALSQKRAESVKKNLIEEFKIAADRMEIDGKGEMEPTDPNTTSAGKANNRRVEFIKF